MGPDGDTAAIVTGRPTPRAEGVYLKHRRLGLGERGRTLTRLMQALEAPPRQRRGCISKPSNCDTPRVPGKDAIGVSAFHAALS